MKKTISTECQIASFLYYISDEARYRKTANAFGISRGSHIPIRQPNQNYLDYINRKGFTSINVQALCDYRFCLLDVVVKWPGSVHDSRIFLQSNLNRKLRNKFVPSSEKQIVEGEMKVSICILGDPLLPFLMKQYSKGGKDEKEQYFGYRLSSARMVIENTFGRLKGRLTWTLTLKSCHI